MDGTKTDKEWWFGGLTTLQTEFSSFLKHFLAKKKCTWKMEKITRTSKTRAFQWCIVCLSIFLQEYYKNLGRYFHHLLGSTVSTYWLLSKASILPEHSGNTRCVLQVGHVHHRHGILSIFMVFSLKLDTTLRSCKVCLPIMRSYIGGCPPGMYSTMSGWEQTFLLAEYSTKEIKI